MSQEVRDYEFFELIPHNPAERQAALDAASDPQWSEESLRVQRRLVQRLRRGQLEI